MKSILQRKTVKEILELSDNPKLEEIKRNYKRLVKQYHPDINKSPEAAEYMKLLNKAYAIATGKEKPTQQSIPQQPQQPQYNPYSGFGFGYGQGFTWRVYYGTYNPFQQQNYTQDQLNKMQNDLQNAFNQAYGNMQNQKQDK